MNPNALLRIVPVVALLALAACSSAPKKTAGGGAAAPGVRVEGRGPAHVATGCPSTSPYAPAKEDPSTRGNYTAGGLYAPGVSDSTPDYVPNVACIPEPLVTNEPRSAVGNRSPYMVLGREYKIIDDPHSYVERGTASYYGSKFHGRLTSNREVYDMYAFTAAHKTLPLPSFALVTNLDNGESVVVRVNDRGPFHDDRVIDLSYAAAVKLGITGKGTGRVEVRGLTPADNGNLLASRRTGKQVATGTTLASAAGTGSAVQTAAARRATDMDNLVKALPAKPATVVAASSVSARSAAASSAAAPSAASATAAAAALPEGERWRYRVQADADTAANADHFDDWMKSRGVRVATGKPAKVDASVATTQVPPRRATAAAAPASTATPVAAAAPAPAPAVSATRAAADNAAARGPLGILLQVASFASRENANRALSQLASAGIVGASVSDIVSGGRTLWRLRVAAEDHGRATELASRIAGLGFGRPQIVKD
ncbi:septal ring lytic transglycosylase RlpA family protein [Xanthomonas sp. CFBP 8703]|uniref:Endolytic peptidoglycan transglycosylase RlpA n=1 Tax=Xanthomonas bonasiae TaxID=2810351 RepID=A0ABS3B1S4_9XANT|nr:septal ring lytic transglycosylase RlpA family protein [Xanthomonas bonasiae]MBN6102583.1 septal ring lytic transglycosylase RlpA family protein [Xanthomonas bonasiae]